jgi:5-methylcytosine-specific restriction endonuclease McrA
VTPKPAPHASTLTPIAPKRTVLTLTIDDQDLENLREAQALLGHQLPNGDIKTIVGNALALYVRDLRKRKLAETDRPRRTSRPTNSVRHIPAAVKRAVRERDGGRCTFVGTDGHRCGTRTRLEWDHVVPVARGGTATVDNLRQRCRAHNQYEAERVFGAAFMEGKREMARRARASGQGTARAVAVAAGAAAAGCASAAAPGGSTAAAGG